MILDKNKIIYVFIQKSLNEYLKYICKSGIIIFDAQLDIKNTENLNIEAFLKEFRNFDNI